ncbi:DNA topoisomerase III [Litchfieldia salsa]|uniref:DNA topoisomerase n=1 Tax=Litchfieldia salsa TaxID=930152 RepID=A0A1H0TGW4_9BACI|nr:DNA topoisomerase III [Litchfieldia salsa]SDP53302.1 DNA topoisomerase-3 [Litchfieldia salsa]
MKVIIAEKPDQASKLASPFKHKKKQGYIEILPTDLFPAGAYVTWAIGHICELLSPEDYNPQWKKWTLQTLPIIPEQFRYRVSKSKSKQFQVIKQLLVNREVREIIHAGDAGREGELIIRTIIETANIKKPLKRLWISSLTENAVVKGFNSLLDETETRNLFYEARSRACADWIVGMNASRVYTLLLQQQGFSDVFSVGRVQTPTLALIVKREKEIANFKSDPFWEVFATFNIDGKKYEGKWHKGQESRVMDQQMAEKIAAFCQGKDARVCNLDKERKEYQPPYLFNLSSLQATANRLFKYSPKKTLDIAQGLYTKGFISYPRSDSSFLTKEEANMIPEIFSKLSLQEAFQKYLPAPIPSIMNNRRYVNEKKVTDHYAIIPTEQVPITSHLSGDEQKIYDLIARRLIAAHYDVAIFDYTTVTTLVDERAEFISKGKQKIQDGWRKVLFDDQDKKDKDVILPILINDEKGAVQQVKVKEGKTQAPNRYTEGQLITLMKTAGKHLNNEELEKVLMKTEGLGTEATRAGIITLLKQRSYIDVKQNKVFATDKAILLIEAIGEKILSSPEMTAKWEQRLSEIGKGKTPHEVFIDQTRKLSHKIVQDAVGQATTWDFKHIEFEPTSSLKYKQGVEVGKCLLCGGQVVDKGKVYGCANYRKTKCGFIISKRILGKSISQAQVKKLLIEGKTDLIKGFKKGEKTFIASLQWNHIEQKVSFVFSNDTQTKQESPSS